jgi:hypothetical protein
MLYRLTKLGLQMKEALTDTCNPTYGVLIKTNSDTYNPTHFRTGYPPPHSSSSDTPLAPVIPPHPSLPTS